MLIRAATPADLTAMMAIERRAPTAAHWSEAGYTRIFQMASPRRVALVVEEDKLCGFLVARQLGEEWEIENFAVAETAQRRGLGAALLGHFLEFARGQGAVSVFLEVRESNRVARRLYEKWSFSQSGRRKSYYDSPLEDALVYRFSFSQLPPKSVEGE